MSQQDLAVKRKLLQNLEKELMCYDCKEVIFTINKQNGYRCQRMHLLCYSCKMYNGLKNAEKKCPCGSNSSQICPLLSELSKNLPYFCQYHKNGCREIFFEDEMKQHQKECVYIQADCISCLKKIVYKDYSNHLEKECSKRENVQSIDYTYEVSVEELMEAQIIKYSPYKVGHNFSHFYAMHVFKSGISYHWIYFIGTREEANCYTYHLKAGPCENSAETNEKIVYSGQVRSIFEPEKEVIRNQNAMMVGKMLAIRLASKSKYYLVQIEIINKKKEEIKDDDEESGIDDD